MRIEGRKNGKVTGDTVRHKNFGNQTVLGKKLFANMEAKGKKGCLKKNWHHSIGGKSGKLNKQNIYLEAHEDLDDQLAEAEIEMNSLTDKEKVQPLSKHEKESLRHVKKMFQE